MTERDTSVLGLENNTQLLSSSRRPLGVGGCPFEAMLSATWSVMELVEQLAPERMGQK